MGIFHALRRGRDAAPYLALRAFPDTSPFSFPFSAFCFSHALRRGLGGRGCFQAGQGGGASALKPGTGRRCGGLEGGTTFLVAPLAQSHDGGDADDFVGGVGVGTNEGDQLTPVRVIRDADSTGLSTILTRHASSEA